MLRIKFELELDENYFNLILYIVINKYKKLYSIKKLIKKIMKFSLFYGLKQNIKNYYDID